MLVEARSQLVTDPYYHYKTTITDTDFVESEEFYYPECKGSIIGIIKELACIKIYSRKKLCVPANLARLYLNYPMAKDKNIYLFRCTLEDDANILDTNYPSLKYGSDIYPCVIRQIKQQTYYQNYPRHLNGKFSKL